ncbi:MAG TPA: hypothetical protein VFD15_06415 [Clostridia bacterium]|nr:hypothetical protein [Clostridia bacterium]
MHILEVGKLLIPGKTRYNEGATFEYSELGPVLVFAFGNPAPEEIQAVKKGRVDLALYESPPVLFILHKIQGLEQWSDSPFSIRMYDNMGKVFDFGEPIRDGMGLVLHIVLVDADTGVLVAQRIIGTPTEFSRDIRAAILRQIEQPFSPESYHRKIDNIYRTFSTKELLRRATTYRMRGHGDE